MHLSTFLVSCLAVVASAAPTYPKVSVHDARSAIDTLGSLSDYFNLLAFKTKSAKVSGEAPVCDLTKARMPIGMHISLRICIAASLTCHQSRWDSPPSSPRPLSSSCCRGSWHPKLYLRYKQPVICSHSYRRCCDLVQRQLCGCSVP